MKTHKDLKVWKDSITLAKDIYELTATYPVHERFGISQQMRRAAVSIASNISEGAARQGEKEYIRFLYIAAGSTSELYTQLEISKLIGFGNEEARLRVTNKTVNVARMLRALIRSMKLRGRKAGIKSTNHESPITNH